MQIAVLIADDHAAVRLIVRSVLERAGDFAVVAEARDRDEARALALSHRPQVCLVDIEMPGGGIELLRELRSLLPVSILIVLSMRADLETRLLAFGAGARAYLAKDQESARIPDLVRRIVANQEPPLPAVVVAELRRRLGHVELEDQAILELAELERSVNEIALALKCSPADVYLRVQQLIESSA